MVGASECRRYHVGKFEEHEHHIAINGAGIVVTDEELEAQAFQAASSSLEFVGWYLSDLSSHRASLRGSS